MSRVIFAFNGDLESCLALHRLVQVQNNTVVTLSINLGQEVHMQSLGELALELGAASAQVVDSRELFLRDFALPLLQANAVYQTNVFLGSAMGRYVVAQELVRVANEERCALVAHSAASKGNDQVRMETAIAALDPELKVLAPVREWNLRTLEQKADYIRRHNLPIEEPVSEAVTIDQNLWGVGLYFHGMVDAWDKPPSETYIFTTAPEKAPDTPEILTIGFEAGVPVTLNGNNIQLVPLLKELNAVGGKHGIGRNDVVEDRLFGIKSREIYETPGASILLLAHRELESLVHSRELRLVKESLSLRYAELAYSGLWFHDLRYALDGFFQRSQRFITGEVKMKLYKGNLAVMGRRSPYSLYDSQLANQSNLDLFDNQWAQGFTSLWTLAPRLAARRRDQSHGSKEQ